VLEFYVWGKSWFSEVKMEKPYKLLIVFGILSLMLSFSVSCSAIDGFKRGYESGFKTGGSIANEIIGEKPVEKTLDTEEMTYINNLIDHDRRLGNSFINLNELFISKNAFTTEWIIEITAEIEIQNALVEEVRNWNTPERYKKVNKKYLEAMDQLEIANKLILEGIDPKDTEKIKRADNNYKIVTELLEEANKMINEIN